MHRCHKTGTQNETYLNVFSLCVCVCVKQMCSTKPEAYLVNVVRLQQHFPQETEEERRRALHGKVRDDVVLVGHGFPLPVLLFHVLLQVETRLLRDVVLFEESLRKKEREGSSGH